MKKFKKVTSILLATMITLSYSPRIEVFANDKEGLLGTERKGQITGVDVTKPVLDVSSLKVDKKEAKPGDRVKISFKATDDMSGIDEENVGIHYYKPITQNTQIISLKYNSEEELYEGYIDINEETELGEWKIRVICLKDKSWNENQIYNSNVESNENSADLSGGNFSVNADTNPNKAVEGISVITQNDFWSNKTIDGDLYVGPNAVLNINGNVNIKGNIYVLGALRVNGGLTLGGTLYGRSMSWGGNPTLYNGTIIMSGSNSISSTSMKTYPVEDLPIRIDSKPLVANNGKVGVKGATLDIADMYIEGEKVQLDYKGRFDVDNIVIGNKDSIDIEFKTVFGNTISKTINLDDHINKIPEIISENLVIKIGDIFDPIKNVKAIDKEDGNITSKIKVVKNTVNTKVEGEYKVVYEVIDSDGNKATKEIKVIVRSNEKPTIEAENITTKAGYEFDPIKNVKATDKEDGDITSKIKVVENTVNITVEGEYKVVYEVIDSDGNKATKEIKVTVKSNEKPIIKAEDIKIKIGNEFDPLKNVKAIDKEDGDITSKIRVVKNTVNTDGLGEGYVEYDVTDSDGNSTSILRSVSVVGRNTQVNSLIGIDRYETAVKLSNSEFASADTVIIVNGKALADGLSATPLATYKKAPILLTETEILSDKTVVEIKRLGAKNAIVIGGTSVVKDSVISQLKGLGIKNVERIGGINRNNTSLKVAQYIDKNCYDVKNIVICNGYGEADALSISSVAGRDSMPIILVDKEDIQDDIYSWLKSEQIESAYLIGGTAVLSDQILSKANEVTLLNISGNRLAGDNRFGTNAKVIDKFYGKIINKVYIAKGMELIDALSAGPVAAVSGSPVVLADDELTSDQRQVLINRYGDLIVRTGGGIPDVTVEQLKSCISN